MNNNNLMDKVSAFGERLKTEGAEMGRKMSEGMSSVSFKMKELFQGTKEADKLVEDATVQDFDNPNWVMNLHLCDMVNGGKIECLDIIKAIKKRILIRNNPRVQYLALVLLETVVKNCESAFSDVASELVLDEMVKIVDDPQTVVNNRNKTLILIESWGEHGSELRFLPVYEETYMSLKSRGIRFPGRDVESLVPIFTPPRSVPESELVAAQSRQVSDDVMGVENIFSEEQAKEAMEVARNSIELFTTVLSSSPQEDLLKDDLATTLYQQCRQYQQTLQRIIEACGDDDALLFEALNVNDEVIKALSRYETLNRIAPSGQQEPEPPSIPVAVEPDDSPRSAKDADAALIRKPASSRPSDDIMDDLDEMIFGKSSVHDAKKPPSSSPRDDLITL